MFRLIQSHACLLHPLCTDIKQGQTQPQPLPALGTQLLAEYIRVPVLPSESQARTLLFSQGVETEYKGNKLCVT